MSLPLVAVPGIMEDQASWRTALAGLSVPVEVIDNRGATIGEMAERLLERAPPRFVLLGHSLGGYVAFEAALKARQRVAALILVSTSARPETDEARLGRQQLVEAARSDFCGIVARLARAALARRNRSDCLDAVEEMMLEGGAGRFAREQAAATGRPALSGRITALDCPVLVITGDEDAVIPASASEEIAAAIPGARLVRFGGCGHMPHLERHDEFIAAIDQWLGGLTLA